MSDAVCTCDHPEASEETTEEIVEEPVEKMDGNPEELAAAIGALQSVLAYLEGHSGGAPEAEAEAGGEEMYEKSAEPLSIEDALETLKKSGVEIYTGKKVTPAMPETTDAAPVKINWMEFSKSFDEIDNLKKENGVEE
jgi:hypothetical protein|tara:strand:- start:581 stop:994 length:414 start_codon:yes stop_codon:yes gene_type:complete